MFYVSLYVFSHKHVDMLVMHTLCGQGISVAA